MSEVFDGYAGAYDRIYAAKDYAAEVDAVLAAMAAHGLPAPRRLLEIGCGTGGHAVELARRGVCVAGLDRSPAMLKRARARAGGISPAPVFVQGDAADFPSDIAGQGGWDTVAAFFAVVSYLAKPGQMVGFLRSARACLEPGGSLVFDVWHGPAVYGQRPETRILDMRDGQGRLLRLARPVMDELRATVDVNYEVLTFAGDRLAAEATETHRMRSFFVPELEDMLTLSGFRPAAFLPMGGDGPLSASHWNVLVLAQAV